MGGGSFNSSDFEYYSKSVGKSYNSSTGRVSGQVYTSRHLDPTLDPKGVMRECCISEEHPNPIPVILGLDVTGSMGAACKETAEALGVIMKNLYNRYKDIEFLMMGIGDLDFDNAPIQASQFESDIRIAVALDKIFMEHGGGGNGFESYTAARYFGLNNTKLESFDEQGRKGIIITMGDEPMNPYLPATQLGRVLGCSVQADVETPELYKRVTEKFDVFHIAINDHSTCYHYYDTDIERSFGALLGDRLKISSINGLSGVICDCIDESINNSPSSDTTTINGGGGISW